MNEFEESITQALTYLVVNSKPKDEEMLEIQKGVSMRLSNLLKPSKEIPIQEKTKEASSKEGKTGKYAKRGK